MAGDGSSEDSERPIRPTPRVFAVANQKGGVGKTTTAVNLSACLAELGYRVLLVDLDPQANATTGLGFDPHDLSLSTYDVLLRDAALQDCIVQVSEPEFSLAPGSLDLAGAEIELVAEFNRERRLGTALEPLLDNFDFVFVDCPPSLGLLTVNALTSVNEVMVPIQCEYYALVGCSQLLQSVDLVKKNLNQELDISLIVLVMRDSRTNLSADVESNIRSFFGEKVCKEVIPRNVRLAEAPSHGKPVVITHPTSRGALAYRRLAKEIANGTSVGPG